ncbi:TPA: aminotransferase class V-fold PLP-dependent enzyme [Legionella anisa]
MNAYQNDFPIIQNLSLDTQPYIFLDNAATTLKPQTVIDAITHYYTHCGATVHRGSYKESERATLMYEQSRSLVAQLINAKKHEIIFTRGTTDSIHYITELLELKKTDIVINCRQEHHANFIPWSEYAQLITIDLLNDGLIDLTALEMQLKTHKVKLVTIAYASNVTGNVQPVKEIVALAKQYKALICIDGAQVISHRPVDVVELNVDFFVFSAHKLFGPSGVGILYIHDSILIDLPHKRFGGGMVNVYNDSQKLFKRPPLGFEPGTPAIEAVIGFGKAIEYVQKVGFEAIMHHHSAWSTYFLQQLECSSWTLAFPKSKDSLPIFTLRPEKAQVDLSYLSRMLSDTYNIAVNDGQQCCGPLYFAADLSTGLRVSAHLYNPLSDAGYFFQCLNQLEFFIG